MLVFVVTVLPYTCFIRKASFFLKTKTSCLVYFLFLCSKCKIFIVMQLFWLNSVGSFVAFKPKDTRCRRMREYIIYVAMEAFFLATRKKVKLLSECYISVEKAEASRLFVYLCGDIFLLLPFLFNIFLVN